MAKCMWSDAKDGKDLPEDGDMFANPIQARMMQPMMRIMMNKMMKVTKHDNDCTQKEVADFMVPSSVGNPFLDLPGTFDPNMNGRIKDVMNMATMTKIMMGCPMMPPIDMMVMHRQVMEAGPAPHNKGITWEKYNEHRGYTTPSYTGKEKSPNVGDKFVDGTIYSIDGSESTASLLAEAKKLADAAGSKKVIISFLGITCPFARAYCFQDLWSVSNGVPTLNVYIREAEPCDIFDAGGMHCTSPLACRRRVYSHKNLKERALVANETKKYFEGWMGKGKCAMWMDGMDDKLEAMYEARPWRQYVVEVATGKIIAKLGLAPFNMNGKMKVIKEACADGGK